MVQQYYTSDSVRQLVRNDISKKLREGSLDLPNLPLVAQKILTLINKPEVTGAELEEVVAHDQKLAARLVKVANSPVYAGAAKITSIQRAILAIGLKTLQEMVFSIVMGEKIFRSRLFAKQMKQQWMHSVATGFIAKEIARMKGLDSEYAYLCGLLHDIGKPLLLITMEDLARRHEERIYYTDELVDSVLKEYHQAVGGLAATAWKFPDNLKSAIKFHHDINEAGSGQLFALQTQVANLMAHSFHIGSYAEDYDVDLSNEPLIYQLNLYPEEVKKIRYEMPDKLKDLIKEFE